MIREKCIGGLFIFILAISLFEFSCSSDRGDRDTKLLVDAYCGSCHHVPDPSSLTKAVWQENILPKMSDYYKWYERSRFPYANKRVLNDTGTIPMTDTLWSRLQAYFVDGGLDEPVEREYGDLPIQKFFQVLELNNICDGRGITAIAIDEYNHTAIAACDSSLLTLDSSGHSINETNAGGLVSGIFPIDDSAAWILDPGILDPHETSDGVLKQWDLKNGSFTSFKEELARPVYLNHSSSSLFISEFGNEKGKLSELDLATESYTSAFDLPGSYKSFVFDFDKDGRDEIIVMFAQALEGVYVREVNAQSKSFISLLSFGPEWGISDIDTLDVNQDGWTDLVVVNGDNADYSIMPKAYHGVRVYLNNQNGSFDEGYHFPLHGASQVQVLDANGDGFQDMLIGSFFAIEEEDRLMLLINEGNKDTIHYTPHRFLEAHTGRWMVMNKGDVDGDGDMDAIIGSFEIEHSSGNNKKGEEDSTDLLLLLNKSK